MGAAANWMGQVSPGDLGDPSLIFTQASRVSGAYYIAALDGNGRPRLFSSLMGNVWEERNIGSLTPPEPARGRIVAILTDENGEQLFLVTDGGQLIVLPDCPKCVRIMNIPAGASGGSVRSGSIMISYPDGSLRQIAVESALQLRVSVSHLIRRLSAGATLVDLRFDDSTIEGAVKLRLEDLESWLENIPYNTEIYFICFYGTQADYAAYTARQLGFERAYSAGGTAPFSHVD